jgi:hypothetical protein
LKKADVTCFAMRLSNSNIEFSLFNLAAKLIHSYLIIFSRIDFMSFSNSWYPPANPKHHPENCLQDISVKILKAYIDRNLTSKGAH